MHPLICLFYLLIPFTYPNPFPSSSPSSFSQGERAFQLRALETQRDESYEGSGIGSTKGGREKDKEHDAMEQDYEEFLDQLEADKEMRGKVNLYKASSTAKQSGASHRY